MNWRDVVLFAAYVSILVACAGPLGRYLAAVYEGRRTFLSPLLVPLERTLLRGCGLALSDAGRPVETGWRAYATGMIGVQAVGVFMVYALQRLQAWLPLNPAELPAVAPDLALGTAVSFVTNTNWQSYGGETTLSHFVQAAGLGVQNFVSAATGMAVAVALARGFARREQTTIGNFPCDLVRGVVHVLLPMSILLAVVLVATGVVQHLGAHATVLRLEAAPDGTTTQILPLGPVASQVAIKQLGTNGGGFFNVNSAHPFENPDALSNLFQCLAILLIPAAFCATFGALVRDRRQGRALLAAMVVLFVVALVACYAAEHAGNPALRALGIDDAASAQQPGGNEEGKEARFGLAASTLWATATTAASNGSVNAMHDSFTPLGGLVPMVLMQLGEVVFGGVGSGLYGMLLFVVVAVFLAGLMVGRTPEYVGKKVGPFELKAACIGLLAPAGAVLVGAAIAITSPAALVGLQDRGEHGFSEVLYACSSASNNNGSAFAGLTTNSPFWNTLLACSMWIGRYAVAIPVLAIAGSLARKRKVAITAGTLPTHGPLFVVFLCAVVVIVGALTFLPSLVLGPIAEHLQLHAPR